jgi:hemolysin D
MYPCSSPHHRSSRSALETAGATDQPLQFHSSEEATETHFEMLSGHEATSICGGAVFPLLPPHQRDAALVANQSATIQSTARTGQWSPSLQNLLDQPPSNFPTWFAIGGILFSVIFGAWAWLGRVQDISVARGRIVPQGEVYKIQPVTQGEVARILVKEGESVKAGQIVVVLDNRLIQTEVDRHKQSLLADQSELAETQKLLQKTHSELETRRAIVSTQIQANEIAIQQVRVGSETKQAVLAQLERKIAAYESRLAQLQPLAEAGAVAQEYIFQVEQDLQEQHIVVTQNQGELQQAFGEDKRRQAELAQQRAEGRQSELEIQQRLQRLEQEIAELNATVSETENLLNGAEIKLEQMYLRAPVSGVMSSLSIRNIGEVVQPSQTVAELAPGSVPLVLSATLPNQDAGFVQENMPVQLKLDAFPYQDHGTVQGRVSSISPDTKPDEQMGAVYRIEVELEPKSNLNSRIELKAGQMATAEIVTRQRRVLDVLLDPIKKLQQGGINL